MTVSIMLKRPLVFIDFETTGVDVEKDRIVEIGFVKYVNDFKMVDSIHEVVDPTIACVIARRKEPRDLTWARKFYCGAEHEGAHGALADSKASAFVLQAQIERYADVPQTIEELARYSNYDKSIADLSGKFKINEEGHIVFGFGKHRDKLALDEKDYLRWMLNADFAPDTKAVARKVLGL